MAGPLYERLAETDIRLVNVCYNGVTVSLELRTYPRTAAPEYDAVSYAWGDDPSTTSVACNGQPLEIRTGLYQSLMFLKCFRPPPKTRPLWIDAICLNQHDPDEKAAQVPLMPGVYENAARTLVWLGEAADDSDLAMDCMGIMTKQMLAVKNAANLTLEQTLANYNLPPTNGLAWRALKYVQQRPWFVRLWTLQELVLSQEPVLLCGTRTATWDALVALNRAGDQANLSILFMPETAPDTPYDKYDDMTLNASFLRMSRKTQILTLPQLLLFSCDRRCSVPVDRVWALLGLLGKEHQRQIRSANLVDYSDSAVANYHRTFLGITKFHMELDTSLAMQMIEQNTRPAHDHYHPRRVPSWCPDWHTDKRAPQSGLVGDEHALAGFPGGQWRHIRPFMQVSNNDDSLELCGLVVDVIVRATASAGRGIGWSLDWHPWLFECLEIIQGTRPVPFDVYPEGFKGVDDIPIFRPRFWETEQDRKHERAQAVLEYVLFPPGLPEWEPKSIIFCNDHKFFSTKAGRFGIGPADLRENDLLCTMYGACYVWVLRPHEPSKEAHAQQTSQRTQQQQEQRYEYLGVAYSPSLLSGKIWEGTSCEAMERFRIM